MVNHTGSLSHIRDLLALAICDGSLGEDERKLISEIAEKEGVTQEETDKLMNDPAEFNYKSPDSDIEKIRQLYNMVHLMMVDHQVTINELTLCKIFAKRIGFESPTSGILIQALRDIIGADKLLENEMGNLLKLL